MRTLIVIMLSLQFLSANEEKVMKFECPAGWRYADLKEYPSTVKNGDRRKGEIDLSPSAHPQYRAFRRNPAGIPQNCESV